MTKQLTQAEIVRNSLKKRYRKEKRFRAYGVLAIAIALSALVILFSDIIGKGTSGFMKTSLNLEVRLDSELMYLDDPTDERQLRMADFVEPLLQALMREIPGATDADREEIRRLLNPYASTELRDLLIENPDWLNTTRKINVLAHSNVDVYNKHA